MRYPDGGGLSAQGRVRREAVRLQAAGWFAEGVSVPEVARRLRVSQTAVYGWRQRWRRGGEPALASKGPGGSRCRLDGSRLRRLADAMDEGPAVHGFGEDQRWKVVPVSGKGSGRISIAGLACFRSGERSRLIFRTIVHRGRKHERRSFAEADYIALLDAAHQQLAGPIVLIWDNLNTHVSAAMRELIAARDWLHVIRLPAYAPDLNPTEGAWSHLKRSIGNLSVRGVDQLLAIVKNRLKRVQYRSDLIDSFLAHTGLTLEPHST